ncbi:hypothetical protein [Nocardia sp. NPDC005366]|uniref:hypothetical protein n=1 Tax=Nocardia sp. NPDC005366 TaxID=3156878 RepID=UPI0033B36158
MNRSLAAATMAGAMMLAPLATAHAAIEPVAPVSQCVEYPIGAPGMCDIFQNLLQLLGTGSSSLSGGSKAS